MGSQFPQGKLGPWNINSLRPMGITFCFFWLLIWLIWIYHTSGITERLSFLVWFVSLNIMTKRFIHIVALSELLTFGRKVMTNLEQIRSVAQSCPTLCNPMNRSTPGLPIHHQLPEFTQTHGHRVSDAIHPSHPLSSPSPLAPNPSQYQSLFQWVNSSHEVPRVLEFQL